MSNEGWTKIGAWQFIWVVGLLVLLAWFINWFANCQNFVNGYCDKARSDFLNQINMIIMFTGGAIFAVGLVANYLVTAGKTPQSEI